MGTRVGRFARRGLSVEAQERLWLLSGAVVLGVLLLLIVTGGVQ